MISKDTPVFGETDGNAQTYMSVLPSASSFQRGRPYSRSHYQYTGIPRAKYSTQKVKFYFTTNSLNRCYRQTTTDWARLGSSHPSSLQERHTLPLLRTCVIEDDSLRVWHTLLGFAGNRFPSPLMVLSWKSRRN